MSILMRTVAVDFDYTLVKRDTLIPGAKEAMQKLRDMGYNIIIHSCNNRDWIARVLNTNNIPYDYIWDSSLDRGKPIADWYIDDRAIGFRGDWDAVVKEIEGDKTGA